MEIEEASAKIRSKGVAEPCPRMPAGVARPQGLAGFSNGRRLDELMSENYRKTYA